LRRPPSATLSPYTTLFRSSEQPEIWEEVLRKLRGRLVPPAGGERPDNASTDAFVAWLEGYLDAAAADRRQVGHVGLHRLNRKERSEEHTSELQSREKLVCR